MRAASATVRTKVGVLPRSDAQRSHWLSSGSLCGESITDNIPHKSNWGIEGSLWETCGGMNGSGIARSLSEITVSQLRINNLPTLESL
jgi:hypothetical protein